jgi:hypothetical protein
MDNDKSIFEKITDKVKEITEIATQAADEALKPEEPRPNTAEPLANYIPLAADGFISDPLMVPPLAVAPARQSKGAAPAPRTGRAGHKTVKTSRIASRRKSAGSSAPSSKKSASTSTDQAARKSVGKSSEKATGRTRAARASKRATAKTQTVKAERAKATSARVARAKAASSNKSSSRKTSRRAPTKVSKKSRKAAR